MLLAEVLRAHGFDVLTTRQVNNLGSSDAAQLRLATENQRALFTHNRNDFEALHRAALAEQRPHAGIILANRRPSDAELARRVVKLLNLFTADEISNQLFYL